MGHISGGGGFIGRDRFATKSVTFAEGAGTGSVGSVALFTVTGEVEILRLVPTSVLTPTENAVPGGATLALGVTNATGLFIAATTALLLATGEYWTEATGGGTANAGIAIPAALKDIAVTSNIIFTVAVSNLTGGTIRCDVYWRPLSTNGLVVAA